MQDDDHKDDVERLISPVGPGLGPSGPPAPGSARGRRITKACARCRKRKIKCDFQFPTCGACALAHAECLGYDAVRGQERPRSTISHLENQVAQLEIELARVKSEHSSNALGAATLATERLTSRLARTIGEPWKSKYEPQEEMNLLSLNSPMFLSQSPLPKFSVVNSPSSDARPYVEEPVKSTTISSIPRHVIDIMLKNYCEIYLPQYPAIEDADLHKSCDRIYANDEPSHFDFFSVAITLAISANTLVNWDEKRAVNAAEEFWGTAVEHLEHVGRRNSWERLQALQLLAHYGLLNPTNVNCCTCASAATRLCLQLGLHRELSMTEQTGLHPRILNARRRLFWTSYSMDAALHSVLCQPTIWPSTAITAKFPESGNGIFSMAHVWSIRQVEAEVTIRMYYPQVGQDSDYSFHHWFTSLHARLEQWNKNAKSGLADAIRLQIFRLNRPSTRFQNPTIEMRRKALSAIVTLTSEYADMERAGKFFYLWYAAHYLTELGAALLESIISGLVDSKQRPTHLDEVDLTVLITTLQTFPLLLRKVAVRWPDIQWPASVLEQIAMPVLQNLTEWSNGTALSFYDYSSARQKLARFLVFAAEPVTQSPTQQTENYNIPLNHNLHMLASASQQYNTVGTAPINNYVPTPNKSNWIPQGVDVTVLNPSDIRGTTPIIPAFDTAWSPSQPLWSVPDQAYSYTTGMWNGPGADMLWDLAGMDSDQIFAALLEGRDVDMLPT